MMTAKPTINDVLPVVRAIYQRHSAGCCLHCLTDDGNVDDDIAQACLDAAHEQGHTDCQEAASMLVLMSKTQRRKVGRVR